MKRTLIHIAIMLLIFHLFGTIVGLLYVGLSLLLRYTKKGKVLTMKIKHRYLVWKYETYPQWFGKHKDSWFFKYIENARWFPWYGKRVIYVKSKDSSKLSSTERDVKDAINAKDYTKALEIVKGLKQTPKTIALTQIIEAKLK